MQNYKPLTCVWEITMGCNMRCKHCGSSCTTSLPGQLTFEEAINFLDMASEIGMQWISISGGEPFMRQDLVEIIKYATCKGIGINVLTNGWLITDKIAEQLGKLDGVRIMISLEGPEYIHDFIRKPGAFRHAQESYERLHLNGVQTGCTTTITKRNIDHLNELKFFLTQENVKCWQLQIGFPMGNLASHEDWLIDPEQVPEIIDFCYDVSCEGKIDVYPADCIGYYDSKQNKVYQNSFKTKNIKEWSGCTAGKQSFGLLHDGSIIGCTSIRHKNFIEGNIKEKSLRQIWEDPNAFSWNRRFKVEDLQKDCLKCKYGERCLGGCPNSRISINGSLYSENLYCTQNLRIKEENHLIR